jgi:hypothetical protein
MAQTFENVTLYTRSGMFGNIVRTDVREVTIEEGLKYAQFNSATKVTFTPVRKRNKRGFWVTSHPFLVIVRREDAIEPDSMFGAATVDENGTRISKSRYSSFDKGFVTDFQAQLEAKKVQPVYKQVSDERGW